MVHIQAVKNPKTLAETATGKVAYTSIKLVAKYYADICTSCPANTRVPEVTNFPILACKLLNKLSVQQIHLPDR